MKKTPYRLSRLIVPARDRRPVMSCVVVRIFIVDFEELFVSLRIFSADFEELFVSLRIFSADFEELFSKKCN